MEPLISVIVPVYNAEPWLERFFGTVLKQTLRHFELICVNDGSTDASLDILNEHAARDDRIKILSQENRGAGAARNAGIARASGKYLSFLDADDFFELDMFERLYAACEENEADVCVCRSDSYDVSTGKYMIHVRSYMDAYIPKKQPFSYKDAPERIFNMFVGWPWDKLFKADLVKGNGLRFQELSNSNDVYFVYTALVRASRIVTVGDVLAHKSTVPNSVSQSKHKEWDNSYRAFKAIKQNLIGIGVMDEVARSFENRVLDNIIWNMSILSDESFARLYETLRSGGFDELGITEDRDPKYYYRKASYKELVRIKSLPLDRYLASRPFIARLLSFSFTKPAFMLYRRTKLGAYAAWLKFRRRGRV